MALQYEVGQKFPSVTLRDDRGRDVTMEDLAGDQPLIMAFYRGPW
jgi:peroxiredoxin